MATGGNIEEASYVGGYLKLRIEEMFHGEISVEFEI